MATDLLRAKSVSFEVPAHPRVVALKLHTMLCHHILTVLFRRPHGRDLQTAVQRLEPALHHSLVAARLASVGAPGFEQRWPVEVAMALAAPRHYHRLLSGSTAAGRRREL